MGGSASESAEVPVPVVQGSLFVPKALQVMVERKLQQL